MAKDALSLAQTKTCSYIKKKKKFQWMFFENLMDLRNWEIKEGNEEAQIQKTVF